MASVLRILTALIFLTIFPFSEGISQKPKVVFVTGDHEYGSEETMPAIAKALETHYGIKSIVLKAYPDYASEKNIPGLEALKDAELAVFFLRWRQLPEEQLKYIDEYLKSGKPLIGFRTSTHAFNFPPDSPLVSWNAFGERAFGSPPGWGGKAQHTHYGHESSTDVEINPTQKDNPILKGVDANFHVRSWLYRTLPDFPPKDAEILLLGKAVNPDKEAIINPVAWTWKNPEGARAFMTTMGHPDDFKVESFQRLVINAIFWGLGKPSPKKWPGKLDINVPYRQP